jgi:hypothetical protein
VLKEGAEGVTGTRQCCCCRWCMCHTSCPGCLQGPVADTASKLLASDDRADTAGWAGSQPCLRLEPKGSNWYPTLHNIPRAADQPALQPACEGLWFSGSGSDACWLCSAPVAPHSSTATHTLRALLADALSVVTTSQPPKMGSSTPCVSTCDRNATCGSSRNAAAAAPTDAWLAVDGAGAVVVAVAAATVDVLRFAAMTWWRWLHAACWLGQGDGASKQWRSRMPLPV